MRERDSCSVFSLSSKNLPFALRLSCTPPFFLSFLLSNSEHYVHLFTNLPASSNNNSNTLALPHTHTHKLWPRGAAKYATLNANPAAALCTVHKKLEFVLGFSICCQFFCLIEKNTNKMHAVSKKRKQHAKNSPQADITNSEK